MKKYNIRILPRGLNDIKNASQYYEEQKTGLGQKFNIEVKNAVEIIKVYPFFQFRYDDVRCLSLSRFPYMLHYSVNEKNNTVYIHAVIHTSLNPEENWIE